MVGSKMNKKLEKERRGVSIHTSVLLGMVLSGIGLEIRDMLERVNKFVMMRSLQECIIGESKELRSKYLTTKKQKGFVNDLQKKICAINKNISEINTEILAELGIPKRIDKINEKYICSLMTKRIKNVTESDQSIKLSNENLKLKLSFECRKVSDSLKVLLDYFNSLENYDGIDQINKDYHKDIKEAINISSFGFGKTSVLCAGRTIEKVINNCLRKLNKNNKINKEEFDEFINNSYNNKIGFLKNRFINEEEFSKLKSFSFDRDKGGHPELGNVDNERARTLISSAIWLVIDLQEKIKRLEDNDL